MQKNFTLSVLNIIQPKKGIKEVALSSRKYFLIQFSLA